MQIVQRVYGHAIDWLRNGYLFSSMHHMSIHFHFHVHNANNRYFPINWKRVIVHDAISMWAQLLYVCLLSSTNTWPTVGNTRTHTHTHSEKPARKNHFVNEKVDKHSYRIHLSCVYGYTLRPCLIFNDNLCAAIIINALIKMRRIVNTKMYNPSE